MSELKVNPAEVRTHGAAMESSAGDIPEPPTSFTTDGTDSLSAALVKKTQAMEEAFINGVRQTKADAQATARSIQAAADKYERSDQDIAGQVERATAGLGSAAGTSSGSGAGTGSQGLEQLQQLAQMPMQMAQMAAQVPMQMAQMTGQVPQAVMQGVQQIGQMTGGLGQNADPAAGKPGTGQPGSGQSDAERDEREQDEGQKLEAERRKREEDERDGAATDSVTAERAPVSPPSAPQTSPAPGASAPESALPPAAAGPRRAPTDPAIAL
ncbi:MULTISPECIES: hypothetical protein [unclassified Mycolicibacterium]|uniref:hypothetical protein n=1 Tax=unclassified Mycolicibacterium TaxID=2636767 RepID=UPI0012DF7E3A|nr:MULTISPECIES: hypothetical protein [unclassified Mycolicibacterium]